MRPTKTRAAPGTAEENHPFADATFVEGDPPVSGEERRRARQVARQGAREAEVEDSFPTAEHEVSAIVPILWLLVPLLLLIAWAVIDAQY